MRTSVRLFIGVAAGALVAGAVAPAQAGTTWGSPQEVSSKIGRAISLSSDGTVAAWIRTNRMTGSGPVRTSYLKSPKKGWTPSAPIPGTAGVTALQVSSDGKTAFIQTPGTGLQLSQRTSGNTWSAATTVISGTKVDAGVMSADANTIAWVDWTGSTDYPDYLPGSVYVATRPAGGAWSAPVLVGKISSDVQYNDMVPLALSSDGSSIAWIGETFALKVLKKNADGTWAAPVLIKQYAEDPALANLAFNATGATLIWNSNYTEGVLYSSLGATGWSPVGYVTSDDVSASAITPKGTVVVYNNEDDQVVLRTWNGTKWAKKTVIGSAGNAQFAVVNKTIAWTANKYQGSTLRASIYAKGKWQPSTKRSSAAQSPALTANGMTLAWGATSNKRTYAAKR